MHSFEGKTALVTGASSGIGIEFALQLAAQGATPILVARREARMKQLARAIHEQCGITAPVIALDLTRPGAISELQQAVENLGLRVDILINNAGFGFQGTFEKASEHTYETMCTLNVTALTVLTRAFLPGMKQGGGILNVASMAGIAPIPYFSVYAATKAYVCSFGSALWYEMKEAGGQVHVSTLCPGPVETEFFDVAGASPADVPAREVQKADDVARIGLKALLNN
ncbi:MAG: SDR family NAD(P)-dependent oxidoreductase, partial [Cyclonatronaceae bacterium]